MIYIIGIAITFFLTLILITKNEKSSADRILIGWFCVILTHLVLFYSKSSNEYVRFPYILGLEIPLPFLHGPFLFLYTLALTKRNILFRNLFFHFVPYTIAFISIIPFLLLEQEEKIAVYQNEGQGYETLLDVILLGIILSGITYTILSFRALKKYKKRVMDNLSYIEKINLQWLHRLIIGLSFIWVLVSFADDEVIFLSLILFVLYIGYYGIKQVGVFSNQQPLESSGLLESKEETKILTVPLNNIKYENSSLSENQLHDIHKRLLHLIKEKKLYQIPELNLAMVSEELGVHPNTLSQVINTVEQKNFFDYINTLRVEEFKERISKPANQKYTLLSLALECGFNSKTSFNRNFKKNTGKSPSEYLKVIKVNLD